ncbi:hypothetical protein [Variovorax terrae]|uniref:Uncharacterized protein n=1 Tax=Variovorax terrae TaxID=2923278 RepID=A0A9X2AP04_9BURK|nr:hypothetical protein [Variovorax terrae]MCJ0764914.1 hypothetical protein [Variovorax terrae]
MIHHLSIAARNPRNVATVFADIFGGGLVIPFRPNQGSFMVFQLDDVGTEIEIHPLGTTLDPGAPGFVHATRDSGRTATHFALSVPASTEQILEIAARQGWLCRRTQRAEFPLVELWIENEALCELLPPDCAAQYLEVNRAMKAGVLQERAQAAKGKQ